MSEPVRVLVFKSQERAGGGHGEKSREEFKITETNNKATDTANKVPAPHAAKQMHRSPS